MNIHTIACSVTKEAWANALKIAILKSPNQNPGQGHAYLSVNRRGKIAALFSIQNGPTGYFKLNLRQICQITKETNFSKADTACRVYKILEKTFAYLKTKASNSLWSSFINWWHGKGFLTNRVLINRDFEEIKKNRQYAKGQQIRGIGGNIQKLLENFELHLNFFYQPTCATIESTLSTIMRVISSLFQRFSGLLQKNSRKR